MKKYELVQLNAPKFKLYKSLNEAQETLNKKVSEGWTLQQVLCDGEADVLIGVFYKEE